MAVLDDDRGPSELDGLRALMSHPGWRTYQNLAKGVREELFTEALDIVRQGGEREDARVRLLTVDVIDLMLRIPDTHITSTEAMMERIHEMLQQRRPTDGR